MKRLHKHLVLAAALGLSAALAGCATTGESSQAPAENYGTVVIENDSPLTVTVYAVRQSGRFRLGTIPGLQREQFTLKRHMLNTGSSLQIMIDPLGSRRDYYSDRIYVEEGDEVRLTVSNFIR